MKVALIAALLVSWTVQGAHAALSPMETQSRIAHCGVERVLVKQLDDPSAYTVHFQPMPTTIEHLASLPVPAGFSRWHDDRYDAETQAYALQVRLVAWKREADQDLHIVVADPANASETMIVEPPSPLCPAMRASGYAAQPAAVRTALVRCFGQPPTTHFAAFPPHTLAVVEGIAFFDVLHHQDGAARNGIELHPLLNLHFDVPCGRYS